MLEEKKCDIQNQLNDADQKLTTTQKLINKNQNELDAFVEHHQSSTIYDDSQKLLHDEVRINS